MISLRISAANLANKTCQRKFLKNFTSRQLPKQLIIHDVSERYNTIPIPKFTVVGSFSFL